MLEAMADGLNTAVKNAKGKQRLPEFIKSVKAATIAFVVAPQEYSSWPTIGYC